MTKPPRVLIVGVDGATFDNIRPWAEAGLLPNFRKFLDQGAAGTLRSTIPPLTAPAWTSFMTGKNPGKHGLYNFVERKQDSYEIRYSNARTRHASTLWQILSDAALRVGVLNVPMTYPPEAVNGYMISGLDAPEDGPAAVYPRELHAELKERFGPINRQYRYLGNLTDDHRKSVLDTLEEIDGHYHRVADYLLEAHPVDVAMVVWTSSDTVQHFFYHYLDRSHPQYDAAGAERYGDAVLRTHQRIDAIIGALAQRLDSDGTLIVMSDHGFRGTSGRLLRLNRFLEELGLMKRKAPATQPVAPVFGVVDRLLRRHLTSRNKERLAAWFPRLRAKWESQSRGLHGVDWGATKAFASDLEIFPPRVWINQQGVFPSGIVAAADKEPLLDFIVEKLYTLKDPLTGRQLIEKVWRKEEIYHGDELDRAPDLTIGCWDGISFVGAGTRRGTDTVSIVSGEPGAGEWTGAHAMQGIVGLLGKAFRPTVLQGADIVDVVPTVLHLLGLEIPEDIDGRVLDEAFTDEFRQVRGAPRRGSTRGGGATAAREAETYTDDESEKVAERLRGLGYTE